VLVARYTERQRTSKFELDDEDKKLIEKWQLVLNEAKRLKPDFTNGDFIKLKKNLGTEEEM
jgi:hypothetical protein